MHVMHVQVMLCIPCTAAGCRAGAVGFMLCMTCRFRSCYACFGGHRGGNRQFHRGGRAKGRRRINPPTTKMLFALKGAFRRAGSAANGFGERIERIRRIRLIRSPKIRWQLFGLQYEAWVRSKATAPYGWLLSKKKIRAAAPPWIQKPGSWREDTAKPQGVVRIRGSAPVPAGGAYVPIEVDPRTAPHNVIIAIRRP